MALPFNGDKEKQRAYYKDYYQRNKERLREYKRDYSKKVTYKKFKKLNAYIDRDLMEKFEAKLNQDNNNITDFITKAIENYVNEK